MQKQIQQFWQEIEGTMMKIVDASFFRRTVNVIVYYALPVFFAVLYVLDIVPREVGVKFGKAAQILLLAILFMKPLGMVFRIQFLKKRFVYRQQLGVAMFYFAVFHAAILFLSERIFDPAYYSYTSNIIYGVSALFITTLLAFTSNRFSMQRLKRNWKRLHYLAYLVLFLIFFHVNILTGEKKAIVLGMIFIILKILEYKKVRLTIPFVSTK